MVLSPAQVGFSTVALPAHLLQLGRTGQLLVTSAALKPLVAGHTAAAAWQKGKGSGSDEATAGDQLAASSSTGGASVRGTRHSNCSQAFWACCLKSSR